MQASRSTNIYIFMHIMSHQELTSRDIIQNLFSAQTYRSYAMRMQSIGSEMQNMLIHLYTLLFDLSKESNDNQMANIAELSKQYNEMVLVSPIREELKNTQKQLADLQKELAASQEELLASRGELFAVQEQLADVKEQLAAQHKNNLPHNRNI